MLTNIKLYWFSSYAVHEPSNRLFIFYRHFIYLFVWLAWFTLRAVLVHCKLGIITPLPQYLLTVCDSFSCYIVYTVYIVYNTLPRKHLFCYYRLHWFLEKHPTLLFTAVTNLCQSYMSVVHFLTCLLAFKEYILMLWKAVFEQAAAFSMYYSCVDGGRWHRSNTSHQSLAASDTRSLHSFVFIFCLWKGKSHKTILVVNEWQKGNLAEYSFHLEFFLKPLFHPLFWCFLVWRNYNSSITICWHVALLFQEFG